MAKDEGKNLGYHWRRRAGVYDAPDSTSKGNASTTSSDVSGLGASQPTSSASKKTEK